MGRKTRGQIVDGILLLDKPAGISSNRALQRARGILNARKAGHTGSLDPFATGMLPLCFGQATRFSQYLLDAGKSYQAVAQLGQATATGDTEGEVVEQAAVPEISSDALESALAQLRGEISQCPPMYSALKHNGKRLYELARAGIEVERPSRRVTIHSLAGELLPANQLSLEVHCSKGTYIRTLVEDLAKVLGTVAYTVSLRRSWVAPFANLPMQTLESLERDRQEVDLLPVDFAIQWMPKVVLNAEESRAALLGQRLSRRVEPMPENEDRSVRLYADEQFIGLGRAVPDGLAPFRMLPQTSA
ncbi:MAG: tRNA pseudouridine(55) synthase TruB [Lysobacterales bacterium]